MRLLHLPCPLLIIGTFLNTPYADGQPPGTGLHAPIPARSYYFQYRIEGTEKPLVVRVPIELASITTAAELDQVIELPAPLSPIRLTRYLPRAVVEQLVVPDESDRAKPAVLISIEGATRTVQRWLLADDPERNRLTSFIGLWRYMAVTDNSQRDELFRQFENEPQRNRTQIALPDFVLLTVGRSGHELWSRHNDKISAKPLALNERIEIPASRYTFRIARFVPAGRLHEEYKPTEARDAVSALRIQAVDPSGAPLPLWLKLDKKRTIPTKVGPMVVAFSSPTTGSLGGPK